MKFYNVIMGGIAACDVYVIYLILFCCSIVGWIGLGFILSLIFKGEC
jgi:hypothetical protein